ncbi:hypothetical protein NZK32_04080 [Cyanobium sp. FGCU-52]|nr:hypothetical protein [Cyanobium sp. FGCU52]
MASWLPRTPLPPRPLSLSRSTEPLLPGASAALDFPGLGQLGHFVAISTDAPAWVSFYSSAAARQGDAGRPISKDPPPGGGVLLDLATTASELTITAPPGGTYFSTETSTTSPPPLRALVRNTGTARVAIALTINVLVLAP